jgi:hypothetical protein
MLHPIGRRERMRGGYQEGMTVPRPRGPLTEALFDALRSGRTANLDDLPATGDDAALALWVLHELHYLGFPEVDESLEWDPDLLRLRARLESDLEARLRSRFTRPAGLSFVDDAFDWIDEQDGPSLARHVHRDADRDQALDLLRVRSIYHLKESDPVAWLVPRLGVRAKAALMELQYDEYGDGDPNRLHHHLYAEGMVASGLEPSYSAHIDVVPVEALEQNNALTLFGLHRRLRGAALGHLAAFEATSSLPSRRMAEGLRRLELPEAMAAYYDEHVEADAVHEQLAVRTICAALLDEEPELEADVWFGAFTCLDLEARFAHAMLDRWGVAERAA